MSAEWRSDPESTWWVRRRTLVADDGEVLAEVETDYRRIAASGVELAVAIAVGVAALVGTDGWVQVAIVAVAVLALLHAAVAGALFLGAHVAGRALERFVLDDHETEAEPGMEEADDGLSRFGFFRTGFAVLLYVLPVVAWAGQAQLDGWLRVAGVVVAVVVTLYSVIVVGFFLIAAWVEPMLDRLIAKHEE